MWMLGILAVLEGLEAGFIEGQIDAVVHAIAGEHEVGSGFFQQCIEAGMQVRAGKRAVGVAGFGEAADGFAGHAEIEHFEFPLRVGLQKERLEAIHVIAGIGDAVADDDDAFHLLRQPWRGRIGAR